MKNTSIGGELLQRANFTSGSNDCNQILRLKVFVNKLFQLLFD